MAWLRYWLKRKERKIILARLQRYTKRSDRQAPPPKDPSHP